MRDKSCLSNAVCLVHVSDSRCRHIWHAHQLLQTECLADIPLHDSQHSAFARHIIRHKQAGNESQHFMFAGLQIVAFDFGCKNNILRRLASFGCKVTVVPSNYPASKVMDLNPDGIFLSNGPVGLMSNDSKLCAKCSAQLLPVVHSDISNQILQSPTSACRTGL